MGMDVPTEAEVAPYGTWASPISTDIVGGSSIVISYLFVDPVTQRVYHIERRPTEGGRSVIVDTCSSTDLFKPGSSWNARSTVHEYGGGAAAAYGGVVYFCNVGDGRLYKFAVTESASEEPSPVTPPDNQKIYRYSSPTPHPTQNHLLVAVFEDHTNDTPSTVLNSLVFINTLTSVVHTLISGADFYAAPTFSPDGKRLAWQQWNHPHMPWTGTDIWVADVSILLSDGSPAHAISTTNHARIASSMHSQPSHPGSGISYVSWMNNDSLLFLAEASGWRNPWVYTLSSASARPVLKEPIKEDFASLYKILGLSYYAPLEFTGARSEDSAQGHKEFLFVAFRGGRSVLYIADLSKLGKAEPVAIDCPFVDVSNVLPVKRFVQRDAAEVVFVGSKVDAPNAVTFCTVIRSMVGYTASFSCLAKEPTISNLSSYIATPHPMALKLKNDEPLHIIHYAPSNPSFIGPDTEKPPCVVNVHGGPTAIAYQSLDWMKQWYTSRGWAWLDVNYRGSSLYGRKYADRLNGNWGVLDVLDCVEAARIISSPEYSLVDPKRCVIRGNSAGGYTVLSYAAGTHLPSWSEPDSEFVFKAGASLYGIGHLEELGLKSHKFESHYLWGLIGGKLDEPGMREVLTQRSPLFHADKITMPLLVLQGTADRIVPKEQSEQIVNAIKRNGGSERARYRTYEGEGHGFARAESKKSALMEEAGWFAKVLGIEWKV